VFGRYERRTWEYDPHLYAPARYRRACGYEAFIPNPIEELEVSISGGVAATLSTAEAAIKELNSEGHAALAPLARLLLRTESIASSKVEGLQVDVRALARAEVSSDIGQRASPTALEVIGNIDAMQLAIENATAGVSVDVERVVEIHRALLERAPNADIAGRIRSVQNWIGGNDYNPCGADYVPPPPEQVDALLSDLGRFCSGDRLSPLVQAAIAHAQFETIHPFEDGNGRTGRALVQIILRRRELAPSYVPPISVILARNKDQYISGLTAYRQGRIEAWLEVFAVAAARAAELASLYLKEIEGLQEQWRTMVRDTARIRKDAAAWKLIDALPAQPIVTLPTAVVQIGRTKPAVNQAIEQLVTAGVLIPLSQGKRNRTWEGWQLLDLIDRLESAEAPEGELARGSIPDVSDAEPEMFNIDEEGIGPRGQHHMDRLAFTDQIYRLGPGSWLIPPTPEPEITIRLAAALPNVLPLGGSGSTQIVTQLRGQRREEFLAELLDTWPMTAWLRSFHSSPNPMENVGWIPVGSNPPEFTELWLAPFGLESRRPPLVARCGFATGVIDDENVTGAPAIQAAVDLMLNLHEIEVGNQQREVRGDSDVSHATEYLSLEEIAEILRHLFDFVGVVERAASRLLPDPKPQTARVGTWISISGGPADQVIDLQAFRRIPRSAGLGQAADAIRVDLRNESELSDREVSGFVADLLSETLERGGYRDIDAVIDRIRRAPGRQTLIQ
jgi:Fic family protein